MNQPYQEAMLSGHLRPVTGETHRLWWESLFDSSEDALVVCRLDGTVEEINVRASRLLGMQKPSPSGCHRISECLTATAWKRLSQLLERTSGGQETMAAISLMSGGRLSMVADVQVTPLTPGYSLVAIKDASRRWRMESHVQRLITAIDSTPDVVYLTDASSRITFVNSAFQTVTGHNIEDVLGRQAEFLRAPSEEAKIADYKNRVENGQDWVGELINVKSDGSTYPVEAVISPIFEKQGKYIGFATFERDLSSKRDLQQQLLLERNFVHSIINSLDSAVYTLDLEFRITHFNDGWKRLPSSHGWLMLDGPPSAGQPLLSYVPEPERRAELQTLFDFVLKKRRSEEIHASSKDNLHHWLIKIAPWWHEGSVQGLIYVVTDHTYLHQLQSQLYQAQKMETVGALAAGVAHDFNNLLLAIRGNVSLITMSDKLSQDLRPRLDAIEKATNRAADITQQLLAFSRASEERETVLDFNQVVTEGAELARRTLKAKVRIKLDLEKDPVKVRIDSTRAQQVLLNLCVNAQDAMPHGGELLIRNRRIQLNAAQALKMGLLPGDECVCCSVRDSGTGIPAEVIPRIFDPFFTTKEKGKGTGLGLSIVHNVVAKAGGFVDVESAIGVGTTFHIWLPLCNSDLTTAPKISEQELVRGSGRVLVVDDLDLVREFTQSLLVEAGYKVEVAASAEEAMAVLIKNGGAFDLVFTDYNMTGKSGWQLMREASQQWPGLKFIMASGYLEEHERKEIEGEFHARILNKPFHMSDAVQLVAQTLSQGKPGGKSS